MDIAPHSAASASPEAQQQLYQQQGSIRLACQACQRKKIKCDRKFPCGQCLRSNLQCAPSQRKPRARHAGKRAVDSELRSRISKLESLVETLSGEVGAADDAEDDDAGNGPDSSEATGLRDPAVSVVGRYIASPFWSSLTAEVAGLREALEDDDADDDDSFSPGTSSSGNAQQQQPQEYDLILCPPGAIYVMPGALNEPSPQLQSVLYGLYMEHVAPLSRIFHLPSLRRMLERGEPYLGQEPSSPGNKAVRAALWFSAANALTEQEALSQFGSTKSDLIANYRRYVDVLLSQADLMVTSDLATIQAFAAYLLSARAADASRRTWTLSALIVRIGQGLGLHHETPGQYSPYLAEQRRRLWHQIRFIDLHGASDRGTEPLIMPGKWDIPLPHNVNDSDFDVDSTTIVSRENCLTDMAFALLLNEANTTTMRLQAPMENTVKTDPWQSRMAVALEFGRTITEKFLRHCNMANRFHRMLTSVGKSMAAGMILRAVRPMNMKNLASFPAPRIDSPYVLRIALDAVREGEAFYADPGNDRWRWLVWVHWHPLAVALAGLCSIRDTELSENAWPIVERAYLRYAQSVADSRSGMLWRPIEKLYKRASTFRFEGRRESRSTSGVSPEPVHNDFRQAQSPPDNTKAAQWASNFPSTNLGNVPLDPLMTDPMNFGSLSGSSMTDMSTLSLGSSGGFGAGDMMAGNPADTSWLDWEKIMTDMSAFDQTDLLQMQGVSLDLQQPGYPMQLDQKHMGMGMNGNGMI